MSTRRNLIVCMAVVALTAPGSFAAAATGGSTPNFTGIFLSTWGTAHVTFSGTFAQWLAETGATVTAQAPLTLDADRTGFTMPVSRTVGSHLDAWGRMAYPGALEISVPVAAQSARSGDGGVRAESRSLNRTLRFGPLYMRVVPDVSWSAKLAVDGAPTGGELKLATADYAEVLEGGGTPSPSGFRATSVPFRLTQDAADLLARESRHSAPAAGTLFGTLTPNFDDLPTEG